MDASNLPPTRKGRTYELHAIGLREFAGLRHCEERLDPFELAQYAKLMVVTFAQIEPFLTDETRLHLIGTGKDKWSGGACSQALPDGRKLIVLNPTHTKNRQNATLMEEISHVFLGHKPSKLAVKRKNKDGKIIARDYNAVIEEQAYSIGAAALVPYSGLKNFVKQGNSSREIAEHFDVSFQLVEFRMKISRLWKTYILVRGDGPI